MPPTLRAKNCGVCKELVWLGDFFRNRSRPDGRSNYCKSCSRTAYGKTLTCTTCGSDFYVKHRNVSLRKTSVCLACIGEYVTQKNKGRADYVTESTKGYVYVTEDGIPSSVRLSASTCRSGEFG